MLDALRKRVKGDEQGFTLIELLVVVIIIGILAAIAIPVFLNQRERAWERATMSDMRNASVVLEEVFSDDGTYAAAAGSYTEGGNTITTTGGTALTLTVSDDVTLTITGDADGYVVTGDHANLDDSWVLDSSEGSVQPAPAA